VPEILDKDRNGNGLVCYRGIAPFRAVVDDKIGLP
jgi:hypothetical protein